MNNGWLIGVEDTVAVLCKWKYNTDQGKYELVDYNSDRAAPQLTIVRQRLQPFCVVPKRYIICAYFKFIIYFSPPPQSRNKLHFFNRPHPKKKIICHTLRRNSLPLALTNQGRGHKRGPEVEKSASNCSQFFN